MLEDGWHETKIRVRYKDTDRMGVVYYGNYLTFFEIGRITASILSVTINSILSPECNFKESRTDLGMVICPLVVIVAIVIGILLTLN